MALPTLSIITPSYQQGRYIEATIRSVLNQAITAEYIVMDGGSTDETVSVLRKYDSQLKWIREKDNGQADAVNKGVARTSGEIIGWLNSDDTYEPGAFQIVLDTFAENPDFDVVYGLADYIDPRGNFAAPAPHIEAFDKERLFTSANFLVQPAVFFRRTAFNKVGGLDPTLHYVMDYDLWLKFASADLKIVHIPKLLAHYRWFGANKTAVGGNTRFDEIHRLMQQHGRKKLPAYIELEWIRQQASSGRIFGAMKSFATSPRAIKAILEPRWWKTILTGVKLRKVKE